MQGHGAPCPKFIFKLLLSIILKRSQKKIEISYFIQRITAHTCGYKITVAFFEAVNIIAVDYFTFSVKAYNRIKVFAADPLIINAFNTEGKDNTLDWAGYPAGQGGYFCPVHSEPSPA